MEVLGGENSRPGELGIGGHVGEKLPVAIRQRADGKLLIQGREASSSLGPRVQEVPRAREGEQLFRGPEPAQVFGLEELKERGVLELTDGDERCARIVRLDKLTVSLVPFRRKGVP